MSILDGGSRRKRKPTGFYEGTNEEPPSKKADSADDEDFTDEEALEGEAYDDHTYGAGKVTRPGWRRGRYEHLWHKNVNANNGTLTCEICHQKIKLTAKNPKGLEVYPANQHYKEQTRPHIDHDQPDWIDRSATIDQIIRHANPPFDTKQIKKILRWAMNAQTLRIVHRRCNLQKQKAAGQHDAAFRSKARRKQGI